MSNENKKIYRNVAALGGFVAYLMAILLVVHGAVSVWVWVPMVMIGIVLCAVFAYKTIVACANMKKK